MSGEISRGTPDIVLDFKSLFNKAILEIKNNLETRILNFLCAGYVPQKGWELLLYYLYARQRLTVYAG